MEDEILPGHCIDHRVCTAKLGQLCTWKEAHETFHSIEGEKALIQRELINEKFASQKNWIIGILVALCLNLVGVVASLGILILKVGG
jgi:hypothetical protein